MEMAKTLPGLIPIIFYSIRNTLTPANAQFVRDALDEEDQEPMEMAKTLPGLIPILFYSIRNTLT